MKEKDYLICKIKGNEDEKPFVARVNSLGKETIEVTLEKNVHHERKVIEITKKDIVVRLGPTPAPGTVYGCDVSNLYRKTLSHDFWGTLYCFVSLPPETLKVLRNSLDRTAKIVEKLGLEDFVDLFTIEIRAKKGKWAGMYKHNKEGLHTVWFAPEWAQNAAEFMDYVILHEFGHVLRYNGLTSKKAQSRWLKLFHQSIKPDLIDHKDLMKILKGIKAAKKEDDLVGFSEALRGLADDDEEMLHRTKILLRWFKQIHHLSVKDLNIMWAAEAFEQLEALWPTVSIDSSKLDPLVSEYGTVSSEELFAESFALHAQKKKLPNSVVTLMDKSLSLIRANKPA
jgi:hypothetical protein